MSSKSSNSYSLKKQFFTYFFWGMLFVWLVTTAACYYVIRNELWELYDGELAQSGRMLLSLYAGENIHYSGQTRVTDSAYASGDNYERKLIFQIWDRQGNLLMRSENAPLFPMTDKADLFQSAVVSGVDARILALTGADSEYEVHVAQKMDFRYENAREILYPLVLILLVAFPFSMALISRGLNRGSRSLDQLSSEIASRTGENLTPIAGLNVPDEILGIINSLNRMMQRLRDAFDRERQFIADAAHELRTPLAGIKAQAQVAIKYPEHGKQSLEKIVEGIDRTTNLANQLLTLSSVDSLQILEKSHILDIRTVLDRVLADLEPEISGRSQNVECKCDHECLIYGDDNLLYTLFRNLLENASRYSPDNTTVFLACEKTRQQVSVSIEDQGPGIPPQERERVFDRFYRHVDVDREGSGLGLAIVERIASLHRAEIRLDAGRNGKGLAVSVSFGTELVGQAAEPERMEASADVSFRRSVSLPG